MELTLTQQVLALGFIVAVLMGAVANKTSFCTMGAVSDWVNMGDTGRMRAWVFAMVVALFGVLILETSGAVSVNSTLPPYRSATFLWPRYILGGILFGIGMTLGSGCGNKTMVRIGGGNIKSIFVLVIAGIFAFLMTKTDFYGVVFHSWMQPIALDLTKLGMRSQDLPGMLGSLWSIENASLVRWVIGGLIGLAMLAWVLRSKDFRGNFDNILGGAVIGLAVVAGWYITGGPLGQEWISEAEWLEQKPINVAVQSYTFINPMGESLVYLASPSNTLLISFGVMALAGVVLGSFVYAVLTRSFRIEWFVSFGDFLNHAIGGVLMGIGGVLAMGCTIGQAVTGVSTLAVGSFVAFISIVFGSALTMKIQYYKMVYEDEASFGKSLLTALVDMRLLPGGMRKLEAV